MAKKPTLNERQLRQGDVLLVGVDQLPAGAQSVASDQDRVVLRYGEATGHAHAFYEPQKVNLVAKKERHLKVVETAYLRHEEHTHVPVPPGIYDLPVQTEWTDDFEPRAVQD